MRETEFERRILAGITSGELTVREGAPLGAQPINHPPTLRDAGTDPRSTRAQYIREFGATMERLASDER
jgi:hypothetical protein